MGIITVIDILIAVILIGAVIFGYMTGLVMRIAHLISLVVAYVAAEAVTKMFPAQVQVLAVFPVVFFIVLAILKQVIKLLKIVDHIPIVGTVNHIGGAIAGFLFYFIIIYIVFSIFFCTVPQDSLNNLGLTEDAIKDSLLLQAFY